MDISNLSRETKEIIIVSICLLSLIISIIALVKKSIPGPVGKDGIQGPPGRDGQDGIQGPPGPTRSPSDPLCINDKCIKQKDIIRLKSIYKADNPYYNIVNRRPIIGLGSMVPSLTISIDPVDNNRNGSATNPIVLNNNKFYYNVFGYNVPPPAPESVRKWRIYGVYSDGLTGGDGPVLEFHVGTPGGSWDLVSEKVKFQFPITWGLTDGENRDAFSNIVDDPSNKQHSKLYAYIPDNAVGTKKVRWLYAELQALDFYE